MENFCLFTDMTMEVAIELRLFWDIMMEHCIHSRHLVQMLLRIFVIVRSGVEVAGFDAASTD